jgi:hypothetical protein
VYEQLRAVLSVVPLFLPLCGPPYLPSLVVDAIRRRCLNRRRSGGDGIGGGVTCGLAGEAGAALPVTWAYESFVGCD